MSHWLTEVSGLLDQADVVMPGETSKSIDNVSTQRIILYLQELGSGKALQFLPDLESLLNTGHRNSSGARAAAPSLSSTSGLGLEIVGRGPDGRKTCLQQLFIYFDIMTKMTFLS